MVRFKPRPVFLPTVAPPSQGVLLANEPLRIGISISQFLGFLDPSPRAPWSSSQGSVVHLPGFHGPSPRVPWLISQGSVVHLPGFPGPSFRVLIYSKTPCPIASSPGPLFTLHGCCHLLAKTLRLLKVTCSLRPCRPLGQGKEGQDSSQDQQQGKGGV